MLYIFECGHTSETFAIYKSKGNCWPRKVCPECGGALANKQITCKCGKVRLIGKKGNEKIEKCADCQQLVNRRLQAAWKRDNKPKVRDYTRSDIHRVEHASRNIPTTLKPDPHVTNPFRSPCDQGCSVFKSLGTYDNSCCTELCEYREAYWKMIAAIPVPEYVVRSHRVFA